MLYLLLSFFLILQDELELIVVLGWLFLAKHSQQLVLLIYDLLNALRCKVLVDLLLG